MSGGENRSAESHSQDAGNCSICGRPTANDRAAEVKFCSVCRSRAHAECVENTEQLLLVSTSAPGHPYVCVSCREGPLVGGDVMMGGDADLLAYNRPHHIYGGAGIELDEEEIEEEEAEELEMDIEEGEEGEFVPEDQEASRSSIVEESLLPNHHHQSISPTIPTSSLVRRSTRSAVQRRLSPFLNPSTDGTSSNQFDEETYTPVDVISAQRTASYLSTLSSPSRGGGEEGTSGGGDSNRLSDDDSPRATPQTDEEEGEEEFMSDNDEYQPHSTARKGGKGKGKGKGKAKPASAAQHSVAPRILHCSSLPVARTSTTISKKSALLRQISSMRTRSGGKPPTTSYAHIASLATMMVTEERGKKGPGRSVSLNTASPSNGGRAAQQSKSTRSRAGGCGGGRGSKFQSMSYLYGLKNKNGEEEVGGGMGKGGGDSGVESLRSGSKQRQLDDEYVRTAIVTSAADKFMCSASLCLVCGSVGKDVEGTMVTCMSCAQSYHTYCVGLHEKLNNTVLKRGWRCLDCTHCEGCGRGSDESNLLLCDECDISFHTYCLDPPLSKIPHGAWRCKWCATCSRCSKQIQSGVDFRHLEGFCETCHSLKKCPKCRKPYEVGELLIKCQRCSRWLHGRCEELLTEEQLENAAENSFRCSLCRPQFGSFKGGSGDSLHSSVIIDNVMVNKAAAEQIQHLRRLMNTDHYPHHHNHHQLYPHHSHHLHRSYGHLPSATSYRSQSHDSRDDCEGLAESGDAGGGGVRQFNLAKGIGGGGPGRRISKVGVGGFSVKMPRRLQLSSLATSAVQAPNNNNNNEDDGDAELFTAEGKPRQRRPRKPKRPRMEDAYPPHIQESFFGAVSVDSKMLAETSIDEPVLPDIKKNSLEPLCNKTGCELTERSADALRSEQEADMLGEIFIGGNIDECFGLDDFNFSDLMGGGDGTEGDDMDDEGAADESLNNDAYSNTGSTRDLNSGILSPSSVAMGPSSSHHHAHAMPQQYGTMGDEQRRRLLHARLNQSHAERAGAGNQATERWEEDEPLGDKATKAAVLYANLCHAELKTKYPNWNDRVKMINRVWRLLDADKRQEYVDMARRNRANGQIRQMRRPRKAVSSLSLAGTGLEGGDGGGRGVLGSWDAETPGPSGDGEGGLSSSSYDVVVRAHIDAIKQAQAQQSQQKQQLQQRQRDAVGTAKNDPPEAQHPTEPNQHSNSKPTDVNQEEADADVAQRYIIMRKIAVDLDRELKAKQDELGRLKRFKKNTLARYRQQQLARGPPPGVDEGESPAIVLSPEVSRTVERTKVQIDDQQEAVEKCKREMRTHQQRVEEFELRHRNELALINNSRMGDSHNQSPTYPTQQPPLAAAPVTPFSPRPGRPSALQLAMRLQMADGNGGSSSNTSTPNRPGSSASVVGVVNPLAKPTRGRKRKRPLHPSEVRRSPILGGVAFDTLIDQLEKDVYDTVDYMLACVTLGVPPALNSSHLAVQRILHSQAPLGTTADGVAGSEPRQRKQRRQMSNSKKQQQQQTSGELANEHEVQLERLRTQLDLIPLPTRSCEDYSSFDKNVANTRHTTHLSDPHIRGIELGGYKLSFLSPEYYDGVEEVVRQELEVSEDERAWNQLEELLPPPMAEICGGVDFDALLAEEDENGPPAPPFTDTKPIVDEIKPPTTLPPSQWTDLAHLSLNSLNDRVEFGKGSLPLPMLCCTFQHSCDLNLEPPVEPHRSLFYKPMLDIENREYKVTLTIDPNEATGRTTEELIGQLRDFLGEDKPLEYSVADTPPQSPQSSQHREIKMEVDDVGWEGMMANHVGHHHCADDNGATPPNARAVKSEGGVEEGDMRDDMPTANSCSEERTMLLDDLKRSREKVVRVTDIASMAATTDAIKTATAPAARGEFKWRGHWWMVCDPQLVQSFQQPEDEVRQKFAAIHLQSSFGARSRASRQEDSRECVLCGAPGDGDQEIAGRLLNVDANEWVHVNCALWSSEVHESEDGALLNVESAIRRAKQIECLVCGRYGASLKCYKMECSGAKHGSGYHLLCAYQRGGNFVRDKTFYCPEHDVKREMRVERLDSLRRIYVQREENQLLAKIFSHSHSTEMMMRVGNLLFHKIGQLLPEQLKTFHTQDYIYPIGYHITRIFWSPVNARDQCLYECEVTDCNNQPQFCVSFDQKEFREKTPSEAWSRILRSVSALREKADNVMLKFYPDLISGEQLFGFTEPAITKMIESLPGVDQLFTYNFIHGGTPLMDLPLAVNPSGCARCEPCFRTLIKHYRKPLVSNSPKKKPPYVGTSSAGSAFNAEVIPREARSTRSASTRFNPIASKLDQETIRAYKASGITEEMLQLPYFRYEPGHPAPHQIHSQYRRLQKEWPNNVYLARSRIQGLGLYAKRDIDMNSMIIEYKGEVIRSEVGEMREKKYMSQNRGVYMFRVDDEYIIDATLSGGLARYVNHSCDPNCSTKILPYNDDKKIIITANRPIRQGEELTYDYQFDLEDTSEKIPCLCGAPSCNKWMN